MILTLETVWMINMSPWDAIISRAWRQTPKISFHSASVQVRTLSPEGEARYVADSANTTALATGAILHWSHRYRH